MFVVEKTDNAADRDIIHWDIEKHKLKLDKLIKRKFNSKIVCLISLFLICTNIVLFIAGIISMALIVVLAFPLVISIIFIVGTINDIAELKASRPYNYEFLEKS